MRMIDLALKDLLQIARDRLSAIFLVVMPLAFTVFIGVVFRFGGEDPRLPVGLIVEEDAAEPLVGVLVGLLERSESIRVERLEPDALGALEEAVRNNDLGGGLVVPASFAESLLGADALPGEALPLRGIVNPSNTVAVTVQAGMERVASRLQAIAETARLSAASYEERQGFSSPAERRAYVVEALEQAAAAWQDPPVRLRATAGVAPQDEGAPSGYLQSSPGIMVQFAIFGLISSATVLVVERKSGVLGRMMSAPIPRWQVIGGHFLSLWTVAFLQMLILVTFGQLVLGVPYLTAPLAILVMIAALALFTASLGLLLGAVARGEDQVVLFGLILMFLLTGLGGAWFPLDITGETFSRIGHLLPSAWAMDGLQNVIVRGQGLASVLLPAGILGAWAIALLAAASWRLRPE